MRCYQYRVSKNRNDNNRLPVARSASANYELYWMVSWAAETLYDLWAVRWQARRARKLHWVYTIPWHSCSPLNSIGGVTIEFCFTVDMFDRLAFPRTHYSEHWGNLLSSKTIAFQFRPENETVRTGQTTQNLFWGPLTVEPRVGDHLS